MLFIEIVAGGLLGLMIAYSLRNLSDNRLKQFFAGTLMIAALIYVGFAAAGVSAETAGVNWLLIELGGVLIYTFFAYAGVKISAWFLVVGWAGHVLWDVGLHLSNTIRFAPDFYPPVCIGFDLVFAIFICYRFFYKD